LSVRFVVGRPGFDSLAESDQKTSKLLFTAFLLDVQNLKELVWRYMFFLFISITFISILSMIFGENLSIC